MAKITLTDAIFYKEGDSGHGAAVGNDWNKTTETVAKRVVRYTMIAPSQGASSVTLEFLKCYEGHGTFPELRFYIGTSPNSHENAGPSSTYTGALTCSGSDAYTFTGNANMILLPNTTYYVWVFPANTTYGWLYWGTISGNQTATTSGAAMSDFAVADGTLGTAQNISVTRYGNTFTHSITYKCGTLTGSICDKSTSASISWTPPLNLATQNTSGDTLTVTFYLQTYSGTETVGETVVRVAAMHIPESVKPSCTVAVSDYMGYADTYGAYVKNLSRLQVVVNPTIAYGAEIVAQKTTVNGETYTDSEFVTNALKSPGTIEVSTVVTDARGRVSSPATKTLTVLDYTAPAVSKLTAKRCNADGTANNRGAYIQVTFSASVTPLNNLNGAEYFVHYKKPSAVDYAGSAALDDLYGQYTVTDYTYIFEAETGSSYEIEVTVEDNHIGTVRTTTASTAFVLMHPNPDGTGMAFCKISEKSNAIELGETAYDKFGTVVGNGLAVYQGGTNMIDANTTLEHLIITTVGTPDNSLWYVLTFFYTSKSASSNRAQIAIPYRWAGPIYHRYYYSNTWSDWVKNLNDSDEHTHQYATSVGGFRFGLGWIGLYDSYENAASHTDRKGYLGYDGGEAFIIADQKSGGINLKSGSAIRLYGGGNNTNFVAALSDRFRASANDAYYLGDSSNKWKAVYAVNGTIQTSDRNQKTEIADIDTKYVELFDRLKPVSFAFSDPESDRIHIGFISQDVKEAMEEVGLSDIEFAGYCRDKKTVYDEETKTEVEVLDEDGNPIYLYSLRYSEFIALNTKMIQMNRQKIAEQESEIKALREELDALKEAVVKIVEQ